METIREEFPACRYELHGDCAGSEKGINSRYECSCSCHKEEN